MFGLVNIWPHSLCQVSHLDVCSALPLPLPGSSEGLTSCVWTQLIILLNHLICSVEKHVFYPSNRLIDPVRSFWDLLHSSSDLTEAHEPEFGPPWFHFKMKRFLITLTDRLSSLWFPRVDDVLLLYRPSLELWSLKIHWKGWFDLEICTSEFRATFFSSTLFLYGCRSEKHLQTNGQKVIFKMFSSSGSCFSSRCLTVTPGLLTFDPVCSETHWLIRVSSV